MRGPKFVELHGLQRLHWDNVKLMEKGLRVKVSRLRFRVLNLPTPKQQEFPPQRATD